MARHFQNDLQWKAESFYRVRQPDLVAQVVEVTQDRLRGRIMPLENIGVVNGQIRVRNPQCGEAAEWDLHGDSLHKSEWDLMALLSPFAAW